MDRFNPTGPLGPEPVPLPGPDDPLEERIITLPCYEPAGLEIHLDGRTACTHSLLLGQTGCGKTSVLRWWIKSLIHHRPSDPERKPGLFIFDLNGDDTVALVQKWAQEAGRSDDLRLLTPTEGHLNLFENIRSLEDLPAATAQFMHGRWSTDRENGYWSETTRVLIDTALSICLVVTGKLETDTVIRFLNNWLIARQLSPDDKRLLDQFEAMAARPPVQFGMALLGKINHVRATAQMWEKLDTRTRGILASCLLDALGTLISLETRKYLDSTRGVCFTPETVSAGRIMVFSLSAGRHLESAALLGRILKARLYVALQGRAPDHRQRLCAIVSDEYHFLASGGMDRSSDVTALATLRSRSVAVVAATQSLEHLAGVMGSKDFRALLPNFGNHFFFRSMESAVGALATEVMGRRVIPVTRADEWGNLLSAPPRLSATEPVCPAGALMQLESGQAYISTSAGFRSDGRLWLAGNWETAPTTAAPREDEATAALGLWREQVLSPSPFSRARLGSVPAVVGAVRASADARYYYDLATWRRVIGFRRFQRTPFSNFRSFRQALSNLGQNPDGLDTLPPSWWEALVAMITRFALQFALRLISLHEQDGCLAIILSDTNASPQVCGLWLGRLQVSVYPVRARPLKLRERRLLAAEPSEEIAPWDEWDEDIPDSE